MFRIAELYPKNIIYMPIEDRRENGDVYWDCAICEWHNDFVGETVYAFEKYLHPSRETALNEMDVFVKYIVDTVKIMSN
jgi:hypothetical protein